KNLALLFQRPVELAVQRAAEFVLLSGSAVLTVSSLERGGPSGFTRWIPLATALIWALFYRRIRRANFAWDATLLAPLGLPLFSYLLLRSKMKHARGAVGWKGRMYAGETTAEVRGEHPSGLGKPAALGEPASRALR